MHSLIIADQGCTQHFERKMEVADHVCPDV